MCECVHSFLAKLHVHSHEGIFLYGGRWCTDLILHLLYSGTPPSPRSDHTATVQEGRYLLIFGGGSHSTCFNDLHILDLDSVS